MSKQLIIAEKPSVAGDIARVLGGFKRVDDYFESDDYVLSSAVGHLVQIAVPDEFEVKRGKWSFANLPVIPPHFDLLPIEKSALERNDVSHVPLHQQPITWAARKDVQMTQSPDNQLRLWLVRKN